MRESVIMNTLVVAFTLRQGKGEEEETIYESRQEENPEAELPHSGRYYTDHRSPALSG